MASDDLDSMLDRLERAADTVGANLLELERDPSYELLRRMTLRGESLRRWENAEATFARLWAWFGALRGVLDSASNTKSHRTLRELLTGPSVEVQAPEVPLRDRRLLDAATRVEQLTPDQAIALMQQDFDSVQLIVGAVGLTWDFALPRLRSAEKALDDVTAMAVELGTDGRSTVRLREDIAALTEALMADPLSVSPDAVDAVGKRVSEAEAAVRAAVALREHVAAALTKARQLAADVDDRTAAARAAHLEVLAKIAPVDVPTPTQHVDGLEEIEHLITSKRWMDAQSRLASWTADATTTLAALTRMTEEIRHPLHERNELRGRLDAYHAKVGRVGRSEDPGLDALYEAARTELYTAPTDLARAARLVTDYADAIPAEQLRTKAGRSE